MMAAVGADVLDAVEYPAFPASCSDGVPRASPGSVTHYQVGNVPDLNDEPSPASHPKVE